jgi:hypothetical protein
MGVLNAAPVIQSHVRTPKIQQILPQVKKHPETDHQQLVSQRKQATVRNLRKCRGVILIQFKLIIHHQMSHIPRPKLRRCVQKISCFGALESKEEGGLEGLFLKVVIVVEMVTLHLQRA